jgi:hypothetical protein
LIFTDRCRLLNKEMLKKNEETHQLRTAEVKKRIEQKEMIRNRNLYNKTEVRSLDDSPLQICEVYARVISYRNLKDLRSLKI